MVNRLKVAREAAKKAAAVLFEGVCDIYDYVQVYDPATNQTRPEKHVYIEQSPCRISFAITSLGSPVGVQTEFQVNLRNLIKLFLPAELVLKGGSYVHVWQNGQEFTYKLGNNPYVYLTHQEVLLMNEHDKA